MTDQAAQDAPTDAQPRPAVAGQVERAVMRPVPQEVCIAWRMFGTRGNGLWLPNTPENKAKLTAWAEESCRLYGDGTHWITERDA